MNAYGPCRDRGCRLETFEILGAFETLIRHNGAERRFTFYEQVLATNNKTLFEDWINDLHNNIIEGEYRIIDPLLLNASDSAILTPTS